MFTRVSGLSSTILVPYVFILYIINSFTVGGDFISMIVVFVFNVVNCLVEGLKLGATTIILTLVLKPVNRENLHEDLALSNGSVAVLFSAPVY